MLAPEHRDKYSLQPPEVTFNQSYFLKQQQRFIYAWDIFHLLCVCEKNSSQQPLINQNFQSYSRLTPVDNVLLLNTPAT